MKLKEIPKNTVVSTPTYDDAKELLAILYENGYKWCHGKDLSDISIMAGKEAVGINFDDTIKNTIINFSHIETARRERFTILTLDEFKEKYIEEEKPQPKFKKGQWVRITNKKHHHFGHKGKVGEVLSYAPEYGRYIINGIPSEWESGDLEPYTEPETKEGTMGTKEGTMGTKDHPPYLDRPKTIVETPKELNLCELLKGHEGETFYSLIEGGAKLKECLGGLIIKCGCLEYHTMGHLKGRSLDGVPLLFPSRALYEQYPLEPLKAWSVWQEEQKKYTLQVCYAPLLPNDIASQAQQTVLKNLVFHTPADYDKCIEEIKAIIEKYSKK